MSMNMATSGRKNVAVQGANVSATGAGRVCERCDEPIPADARPSARFCSRNCQKRSWDEKKYRCPRCGGERWRRAEHCRACELELRRLGSKLRDEDIVLMWESGMSLKAIIRELGYGPTSQPPELSRLMREGRIQARREGYRRRHELERAA